MVRVNLTYRLKMNANIKGTVVSIAFAALMLCLAIQSFAQESKTVDEFPGITKAITNSEYKGIDGLLIAQNGNMIYEKYFNGFGRDSLHDSRSSFKSVTSLLVGIAIDQGFIKNENEPVYRFFPENKGIANDPVKKKMTIKNLLEMRSGFDCNEWTDDGRDCEAEMSKTRDWVQFSLGLSMKNEPGKVWAYTSCDPMIVSGIISQATHMTIMEFARKYLFEPLGISNYEWTTDSAGHGMTAGSFYVLPSDMLKIGLLILNNGNWNGKQIVSAGWLEKSITATIPIPDGWSFIKVSRYPEAIPQQAYYGYYWYKETVKTNSWHEDVVFASGNGGQYIMVIRRLDLVVVFTQQNYQNWTAKRAFEILAKYIIPQFEK
jgi:CubicO group peptidase (beta-lactamase class C family)